LPDFRPTLRGQTQFRAAAHGYPAVIVWNPGCMPGQISIPGQISLRPERLPDDAHFLLSLYAHARRAELAALGWSRDQEDAFIRMQFDARELHYRTAFPAGAYSLIRASGERAGRLIVDWTETAIVIVDIALVPPLRRRGIGSLLVGRLLAEAEAGQVAVRCHVQHDSDARWFWQRAGFTALASDGAYIALERQPGQPGRADQAAALREENPGQQ
jgi:GNAT superfamily N-acetyltransferase